jgi:hypothetical protein
MRSRLVTLLVLLLALAVPLQGLLASAWPVEPADAPHAAMVAVADKDADAAPCHGHGQDSAVPADSAAGCGCCAVCGSAALPPSAPVLEHHDLRCSTAAAPPAAVIAFVTEGPERPPRG